MIFLLLPHFLNYWCVLGRIHPPILLNQSILKVTHTIDALMKTQTCLLLVLTNTTTWHSSCVATILSLVCIQQTCRQNTAFIYNFEDICSWTLKWNVTNVSKLWMKEREKWRSEFRDLDLNDHCSALFYIVEFLQCPSIYVKGLWLEHRKIRIKR